MKENLFQVPGLASDYLLAIFIAPWLEVYHSNLNLYLHIHSLWTFILTWPSSYKKSSHIGFGIPPTPVGHDVKLITSAKPYFLIWSHSEILGVRASTYLFLRGVNQSITRTILECPQYCYLYLHISVFISFIYTPPTETTEVTTVLNCVCHHSLAFFVLS